MTQIYTTIVAQQHAFIHTESYINACGADIF